MKKILITSKAGIKNDFVEFAVKFSIPDFYFDLYGQALRVFKIDLFNQGFNFEPVWPEKVETHVVRFEIDGMNFLSIGPNHFASTSERNATVLAEKYQAQVVFYNSEKELFRYRNGILFVSYTLFLNKEASNEDKSVLVTIDNGYLKNAVLNSHIQNENRTFDTITIKSFYGVKNVPHLKRRKVFTKEEAAISQSRYNNKNSVDLTHLYNDHLVSFKFLTSELDIDGQLKTLDDQAFVHNEIFHDKPSFNENLIDFELEQTKSKDDEEADWEDSLIASMNQVESEDKGVIGDDYLELVDTEKTVKEPKADFDYESYVRSTNDKFLDLDEYEVINRMAQIDGQSAATTVNEEIRTDQLNQTTTEFNSSDEKSAETKVPAENDLSFIAERIQTGLFKSTNVKIPEIKEVPAPVKETENEEDELAGFIFGEESENLEETEQTEQSEQSEELHQEEQSEQPEQSFEQHDQQQNEEDSFIDYSFEEQTNFEESNHFEKSSPLEVANSDDISSETFLASKEEQSFEEPINHETQNVLDSNSTVRILESNVDESELAIKTISSFKHKVSLFFAKLKVKKIKLDDPENILNSPEQLAYDEVVDQIPESEVSSEILYDSETETTSAMFGAESAAISEPVLTDGSYQLYSEDLRTELPEENEVLTESFETDEVAQETVFDADVTGVETNVLQEEFFASHQNDEDLTEDSSIQELSVEEESRTEDLELLTTDHHSSDVEDQILVENLATENFEIPSHQFESNSEELFEFNEAQKVHFHEVQTTEVVEEEVVEEIISESIIPEPIIPEPVRELTEGERYDRESRINRLRDAIADCEKAITEFNKAHGGSEEEKNILSNNFNESTEVIVDALINKPIAEQFVNGEWEISNNSVDEFTKDIRDISHNFYRRSLNLQNLKKRIQLQEYITNKRKQLTDILVRRTKRIKDYQGRTTEIMSEIEAKIN
ncbi:hypothetical protein J2Z62_000302 [Mycoplasmoides fastidiosum]|uniref:Uncharacterized protein n=1 Tax=Mycoplasmoides fastidiosum TaxID=92758 RepID=A0ABU0LYU6_9BACT|nr:hypothetical protein [Mycoplasmoides fastidiosum]MDQ0513864.1 hypothetical protein [Mycoplasmoides fastidiosum]UUD37722.1 hypothetical protein NPA10_04095 [Mycoplasmoides fastidiosum]